MTQEELKARIHYDPETGIFTWLKGNRKGKTSGSTGGIYIQICFSRKNFIYAHRLAFLYMVGKIPKEVDHINLVKHDNRWSNLRPVTRGQNNMNRGPQINNKSGFRGVYYQKDHKKYVARLSGRINGERTTKFLGYFDTPQQAYEAYKKETKERYGEYFRE